MRTQAGQQFDAFEQIGFALAIGPDHQQPGGHQIQVQGREIAELPQFQTLQPHGEEAASG